MAGPMVKEAARVFDKRGNQNKKVTIRQLGVLMNFRCEKYGRV